MIPYIFTSDAISLFLPDNKSFSIRKDHKYFKALVEAINASDDTAVLNVVDMAQKIANFVEGKVVVQNGQLFYGDELLSGAIVDRILQGISMGLESKSYILFLENLMKNPSFQSRKELYLFLEACDLPITEDGRFIAYKSVRDNYYDAHSGKYLNKVGAIIEMPRHLVNDDRQQTCSAGLHVCSRAYGKFSQRLLLVAVNPADVVSVPYDYNNAKMRVCKYEVLKEIEEFQSFSEDPVWGDDEEEEGEIDTCPECGSSPETGAYCSSCGASLS